MNLSIFKQGELSAMTRNVKVSAALTLSPEAFTAIRDCEDSRIQGEMLKQAMHNCILEGTFAIGSCETTTY